MTTLLFINASASTAGSISMGLSEEFKAQWQSEYSEDEYIDRDIGSAPPSFITEAWISAVFTPEAKRTDEQISLLALSDRLIDELSKADIIVLSTPMYNYGMPASLKAWVDQVIRVNKTFTFDLSRGDFPLEPTMSGKALVLLSSCGEFGFGASGIREQMNHLGTHIHTLNKYLGVDEQYEIRVEYQEFGDTRHEQSIEDAYAAIPALIKKLGKKYHLNT